jgi:hypothetical protein
MRNFAKMRKLDTGNGRVLQQHSTERFKRCTRRR